MIANCDAVETDSRLLLVDAGNTRTKIGVFADRPPTEGQLPQCVAELTIENGETVEWARIARLAGATERFQLVLTGSNPVRVAELTKSVPVDWPAPLKLPPRSRFPLAIDVDFPERVGIDRLLNAIAANQLRLSGQSAVIVSSGTATTIDYVSPDGRFCGGAILPGFELSARALHQYTALLPLIPLDVVLDAQPSDVGRNTEAALRSGLYWGHVGGVKELVRRLLQRGTVDQQTASGDQSRHLGNAAVGDLPLLVVTGGAAPLLLPHLPSFVRHEPQLPLQGLAILMHSRTPHRDSSSEV
ncbi:MAG: type III pantothenate kinase [Planctomycetaceae bacterium]|nr:type III pantothenate kinase [Planctomycetaceae bacterium]